MLASPCMDKSTRQSRIVKLPRRPESEWGKVPISLSFQVGVVPNQWSGRQPCCIIIIEHSSTTWGLLFSAPSASEQRRIAVLYLVPDAPAHYSALDGIEYIFDTLGTLMLESTERTQVPVSEAPLVRPSRIRCMWNSWNWTTGWLEMYCKECAT